MQPFFADLRFSSRRLRKNPAFSFFALLTLAIGIGSTIAIFGVVETVLLRPLPLRDADRLVVVWEDASKLGFPRNTPAPANFVDWKLRNHVFEDMGALQGQIYAVTGSGFPEQIEGNPVTADLFPMLGVHPVVGRVFTAEEDRPGGPLVALISHRLWTQRYAADLNITGRQIRLNGVPHQIIGVMPQGFAFPDRSDVWTPMAFSGAALAKRGSHYLVVYARLKPGVKLEDAQREMSGIAAQLAREYPVTNQNIGAVVVPLREQIAGKGQLAAIVLAAGVACVLLITCANVAALLLARAAGMQGELAVRAALGAGRARLAGLAISESLLLAGVGGGLGVGLAVWVMPFLGALVPMTLFGWKQPELSLPMVTFAIAVSSVSALLFGAAPALAAARLNLSSSMRQGGRGAVGGHARLRKMLIVGEVALAVVVVIAAGLMIQTFWRLSHVDLGFVPSGVLTARTSLPVTSESPYSTFEASRDFYRRVLEATKSIPGVLNAGYTTFLPLTNRGGTSGFEIEHGAPLTAGLFNDANHRVISPGYLETIGVPLRAGRFLLDTDGPENAPVMLINESMARQYWPNQDPLDRRIRFNNESPWIRIIGVVGNIRQMGLEVEGRAEMYFPSLASKLAVWPILAH